MNTIFKTILCFIFIATLGACSKKTTSMKEKMIEKTAEEILGNPDYRAISYGGYRTDSRDVQPSIEQLKEDFKILQAMGIKVIRTYNVHLPHAENALKAINELQKEDETFEMYVMLGAWIDCKNAWTDLKPIHNEESESNEKEIAKAVELANEYPHIIKVIAVGNEAMVKWATTYYVEPWIILKWVRHLQELKKEEKLDKDLWITSSDNFASWGGGGAEYHVPDLDSLVQEVDYISMHTYPMHDTHYNPVFWGTTRDEQDLTKIKQIDAAMNRSLDYAKAQYDAVVAYMKKLGVDKPVHIGETGWASYSNELYGPTDSKAVDEYKEALFHEKMRAWTDKDGISCFYFEAFDEPWKDSRNEGGSENHFGLFTVDGKAKYALWDLVDEGKFKGLTRDGNKIIKTYGGDKDSLLIDVLMPPVREFEKELVE